MIKEDLDKKITLSQKKKTEKKSESNVIQLIPYPSALDILTTKSKSSTALHLINIIIITTLISYYISTLSIIKEKFKYSLIYFQILLTYIAFIIIPNPKRYKGYSLIFFKMLMALSLVYFFNLCFLTILDNETLRFFLILIDPSLSQKIEERSYSNQCEFYTPESKISNFENIYNALDVYISAHFFGWLVKTLVFRNHTMIWTLSIGFELYEYSLKHILPNFCECWWDHLLLDLFGCNLLGIIVGFVIINKFGLRKYDWFYESTEKTKKMGIYQQLKYCIMNVGDFIKNKKWNFLSTPNNYLGVLLLIAVTSLFDLSNFFNKAILNIPSNHYFLAIRIFILGFFCLLVTSEFYDYLKDKNKNKQPRFSTILFIMIIIMEWFLFFKNVEFEFFAANCPIHIKIFWSLISFILFTMLVYSIYNKKISSK